MCLDDPSVVVSTAHVLLGNIEEQTFNTPPQGTNLGLQQRAATSEQNPEDRYEKSKRLITSCSATSTRRVEVSIQHTQNNDPSLSKPKH